jgi:hypothetical protein
MIANPKEKQPPVVRILNEDRACDLFREWIPGKSPEQHEEMAMIEQIRAINAQARQEDIARNEKWRQQESEQRDNLEKAIERRHQELQEDAERRHAETLKWQKKVEERVESRHGRTIGFSFLNVLLSAALTLGALFFLRWLGHLIFGIPFSL